MLGVAWVAISKVIARKTKLGACNPTWNVVAMLGEPSSWMDSECG